MSKVVGLVIGLGLGLASSALRAESCSEAGRADSFECLEVLIEHGAGFDRAAFLAAYPGTLVLTEIPSLGILHLRAPDAATAEDIETSAEAIEGVLSAELNHHLVSPECRQLAILFDELGHSADDLGEQAGVLALGAPEAWPLASGTGIVVAVIDTGADFDHPALAGHLLGGGSDWVDGDGDPSDVANGVDDDGDGVTDLGRGHGTFVASLVAAVAPEARILPLRVVDDECRTTAVRVAAALVEAVDRGAQVINLSLGMQGEHELIKDAIRYSHDHGSLVIVSAGNGAEPRAEFPAYRSEALAVAAVDDTGVKADFSNWDSDVELSAPGVWLLGAVPSGGFARGDGTSFATALVSGAAALTWSASPCLDGRAVGRQLADTARAIDGLPGNEGYDLGEGLVDAARAAVPGAAIGTLAGLKAVKLPGGAGALGFAWSAEGFGGRVYSVADKAQASGAGSNGAVCPSCPAPSLVARCEAPAGASSCEALLEPATRLYFRVAGTCGPAEGAP